MDEKQIIFTVFSEGEKKGKRPDWKKAEAVNARCPECKTEMIVVIGHGALLYGYCTRCQQYYVGE